MIWKYGKYFVNIRKILMTIFITFFKANYMKRKIRKINIFYIVLLFQLYVISGCTTDLLSD